MKKYKKNILLPGGQELIFANGKISILDNPKAFFIEDYDICLYLLRSSYIEKR